MFLNTGILYLCISIVYIINSGIIVYPFLNHTVYSLILATFYYLVSMVHLNEHKKVKNKDYNKYYSYSLGLLIFILWIILLYKLI